MIFKNVAPQQLKKSFIIVLMLVAIGVTTALTSGDVDLLCNSSESFLYRNGTGWGCGFINDLTYNVTINNVTYYNLNESDPVWTAEKGDYVPYTGATQDVELGDNNFNITGITQFGFLTPSFNFDATTGSLESGINVIASPSLSYGTAIALGINLDNSRTPAYTVEADGDYTLAINGRAKSSNAIAIGQSSYSAGSSSIALGEKTEALQQKDIGIGFQANADGTSNGVVSGSGTSVAIGWKAQTSGISSVAIGAGTFANNDSNVVIGTVNPNLFPSPQVINTIPLSILLGIHNTGGQQNLIHAEFNKGVRIGATTGESITMSGDDLYIKDNTEIDGFLVLGTNTETGLTDGDINASTIYYDTLTAKSPTFLCEQYTNWCQITVPQYQKSLYVDFTQDWQVEEVQFDGVTYTPNQFINEVCPTNSKTQAICDEIVAKYQKLKAKYDTDQVEQQFIQTCESQGFVFENEQCVSYTTTTVTYAQAVESYQEPIYNYKTVIRYELNETLQPIAIETRERDSITGYNAKYKFKNGCGWTQETGYICITKEVIN